MIKKIARHLKYRNIKLKSEGSNCQYKALSSVFIHPQNISIGNNVNIGPRAEIDGCGGIEIGNGVIIAPEVCILTRGHNFDSNDLCALPFDNRVSVARVIIKDYVWIGKRAIILPGVTIGKAAVVGAGTVVSKDVPDYAIAAGNPAKVIRYRDKEVVEKLLNESEPFICSRYGHKKIFIQKHSLNKFTAE